MTERKKFLVVEDDDDLAENLVEVLQSMGCDAASAASAEAALLLLEQDSFDAVITDFRLPGADGVELINALRARGVPVPIVVTSAYIDRNVATSAEVAGALDVLSKPLDLKRLLKLVETVACARQGVLIVEDNAELARNVSEALEDRGVDSTIGDSAESALAHRRLPRVALVDLRLPDESGLEVARRLCARDPNVTILFVTGTDRADSAADVERLAASLPCRQRKLSVLQLPFDLPELVQRVCAAASRDSS